MVNKNYIYCEVIILTPHGTWHMHIHEWYFTEASKSIFIPENDGIRVYQRVLRCHRHAQCHRCIHVYIISTSIILVLGLLLTLS